MTAPRYDADGEAGWLTLRHHRTASPRAPWRSSVSFVQVLLKQGLIDRATLDAFSKEAGLYAQALCIDCSPEVERETMQIVKQIKPEIAVADVFHGRGDEKPERL